MTEPVRLSNGQSAVSFSVESWSDRQLVSPVDCFEFEQLHRTIRQLFPETVVAPGLTAVSTDSHWYYGLTDKVYRFIPMRLSPQDVARIHGVNERISTDNLAEITRFYVQLVRNTDTRGSF